MSTTCNVYWGDKVHHFYSDGCPSVVLPELGYMARLRKTSRPRFLGRLQSDWEFVLSEDPDSADYGIDVSSDWSTAKITCVWWPDGFCRKVDLRAVPTSEDLGEELEALLDSDPTELEMRGGQYPFAAGGSVRKRSRRTAKPAGNSVPDYLAELERRVSGLEAWARKVASAAGKTIRPRV